MSLGGALKRSPPGSEERVMAGGGAGPSSQGGGGPSSGHSSGASSSAGGNAACAACKYQRRKCATNCPLAPYFPPDQPKRFLNVHRLFGVSSILRILRQVEPDKRDDTVKSIVYEADTREKDPVHGCLGIIHLLQNQVNKLKGDLAQARDQLYLLEQQHTSNLLQQSYEQQQHAGSQANYHYHHLQPQYASTAHQGASFHDAVPGQLMTYQDSRTYHDHARYLVSDQESPLQDMLGHHIKVESASDPYVRSSMDRGLRYVSDSGGHHMHEQQCLGDQFSQQHQGGSSSTYHALTGGADLGRRSSYYNPLINPDHDHHVAGRHVDPLRSVATLQVLDPLTNHSLVPVASDPELRNAGVHLSLTNRYSM